MSDSRVAVVETVLDVGESQKPFGKRWNQEEINLNISHLEALRQGKCLAVDVQEEYVVFLKLAPSVLIDR